MQGSRALRRAPFPHAPCRRLGLNPSCPADTQQARSGRGAHSWGLWGLRLCSSSGVRKSCIHVARGAEGGHQEKRNGWTTGREKTSVLVLHSSECVCRRRGKESLWLGPHAASLWHDAHSIWGEAGLGEVEDSCHVFDLHPIEGWALHPPHPPNLGGSGETGCDRPLGPSIRKGLHSLPISGDPPGEPETQDECGSPLSPDRGPAEHAASPTNFLE